MKLTKLRKLTYVYKKYSDLYFIYPLRDKNEPFLYVRQKPTSQPKVKKNPFYLLREGQ